jgi:hypothetical protein
MRSPPDKVMHPFLLGVYLVLHMVAANPGQAYLDQALRALVVVQLALVTLFWLLRRILGSSVKAGLLTTLGLAAVFANGALRDAATRLPSRWILENHFGFVLGLELLGVGALAFLIVRHPISGAVVTRPLNVFALVLILLPPLNIAFDAMGEEGRLFSREPEERVVDPGVELRPATSPPPDIYYVVLDGHARSDTLRTIYGYDDSEFVGFLRDRGFFVAEKSSSNYLATRLLVPAVLSFDYIEVLAGWLGRGPREPGLLQEALQQSRVVTALSRLGYRIVNITSGVSHISLERADEDLGFESSLPRPSEFESALLDMTPLPGLADRLLPGTPLSPTELHRKRVEYAIDQLGGQGAAPGPKLVFAHVFCPHDPFVFGPHGEERGLSFRLFTDYSDAHHRRLMRAYGDQTRYLHELMMAAITRILEESPRPPVIVLQGDHGLRLFLNRRPEDTCLRESFSILNAIYLPDGGGEGLYDTISPVNTFRVVFDAYFGTDLGLVEDRAYFSHRFGIFDFVEVTDQVESCSTLSRIPSLDESGLPD